MFSDEIELLAPCGSRESVTAAVNSGCNAIYMGGKNFNARAYASNFSDEDLKEIINYSHQRDVRTLITLNILYKDNEINPVLDFVSKIYSYGADAIIVQDMGLFSLIKENFPDINLNASTQLTTHNLSAVKKLRQLGFDRVVLSRELSLEEIKYIADNKGDIELEVFIHGALCVCYSGRCLMSSVIGERSGNRGRCAQPCRMTYQLFDSSQKIAEGYLLSPKDISTVDILPSILNSGVKSLKIEGRMKSPEYVSGVVSTYRKYIDSWAPVASEDKRELTQIFNRGGSSSQGYFTNWAGTDMISASPKNSGVRIGTVLSYSPNQKKCTISLTSGIVPGDGIEIWTRSPEHAGTNISKKADAGDTITLNIIGKISKGDAVYKTYDKLLNDKLSKTYQQDTRTQLVSASVIAKKDTPLELTLTTKRGVSITVTGDTPSTAENQPVTKERLVAQLSKTGGTAFKFKFDNVELEDNLYIPMTSLNNLRREASAILSAEIEKAYTRDKITVSYTPRPQQRAQKRELCVYVTTDEQFEVALLSRASKIYIEITKNRYNKITNYISKAHSHNKELFLALPRINRYTEEDIYTKYISSLESTDLDGYLVRNYGELETTKKLVFDYTFNVFNHKTLEFLANMSSTVTLSPELNLNEITALSGVNTEVYAYGRLPLMTTHQCPVGLYKGNKKSGKFCSQCQKDEPYFLRDRKNVDFPILTDCENCVAVILNSAPIFLLDKYKDMLSINSAYYRVSLTTEDKALSADILEAYSQAIYSQSLSSKAEQLVINFKNVATHGHFYRGVL